MGRQKSEARSRLEAIADSHSAAPTTAPPYITPGHALEQDAAKTVGADLERLSAAYIDAINQRDWTYTASADAREAVQHVHPAFKAYGDNCPRKLTWGENIERFRGYADADGSYYMAVPQIDVDVDVCGGSATVFVHLLVTGLAGVGRMEGMMCFHWRHEKGKWWCLGTVCIRRSDGFV